MRKRILNILTIALCAAGCAKDELAPRDNGIFVSQPITVDFSVSVAEPAETATKALGENPSIQSLRVAVFNEAGYLEEYVPATFTPATSNNTQYAYKVELTSSDKPRSLHFIANGPESLAYGNETTIIRALSTSNGQDAYWQNVALDNILPADYTASTLVLEPTSKAKLSNVKLIRNFSKLTISANPLNKTASTDTVSNFKLVSFRLVNVPKSGSLAPYNRMTSKFVADYQNYNSVADLRNIGYEGYEPAKTDIDTEMGPEINVTWVSDGVYKNNNTYMYERENGSTTTPTYVLIKGYYYKNGTQSSSYRYYKVCLRDRQENGIALLRNFNYNINILQVQTEGSDSWAGALATYGSGEISTSVEAEHLTNISNGTGRMFVDYTSKTVVKGGNITLRFRFIPDESKGQAVDNSKVTVTKEEGSVIKSYTVATSDDANGFRTITLNINNPSELKQTQVLYVIGIDGDGNKVQRKIYYTLIPPQNLLVDCIPTYVKKEAGADMQVKIRIPGGLPSSMFPLDLKIEASEKTLTTNNDYPLPVRTDYSFCPDKAKRPSFYYLRTITYSEYQSQEENIDDEGNVSFICHFKTNTANSASHVCVYNEYFNYFASTATDYSSLQRHYSWDQFFNYVGGKFANLTYNPTHTPAQPDEPFTFKFDLSCPSDEVPEKITITLTGAYAVNTDGSNPHLKLIEGDTYEYDTQYAGFSQNNILLNLKTFALLTNVKVALKGERFEDAEKTATPWLIIRTKVLNLLGKISNGAQIYVFKQKPTIDLINNASSQSLFSTAFTVGQDGTHYYLPDIDLTDKGVDANTKLWFAYKNSEGYFTSNQENGDLLSAILTETDKWSYDLNFTQIAKKKGSLSIGNYELKTKEVKNISYTYNGSSTGADITFTVKSGSSDIASISKVDGVYKITAKKPGKVTYTATVPETLESTAASCDFTIDVTRKFRKIVISDIVMSSLDKAYPSVTLTDVNGTAISADTPVQYSYTTNNYFSIASSSSDKTGTVTSAWGGSGAVTVNAKIPATDEWEEATTSFKITVNKRNYTITLDKTGTVTYSSNKTNEVVKVSSRTDDKGQQSDRPITISVTDANSVLSSKSVSGNTVTYSVGSNGGKAYVTVTGSGDNYYNSTSTSVIIRRVHWVRVTSVDYSSTYIFTNPEKTVIAVSSDAVSSHAESITDDSWEEKSTSANSRYIFWLKDWSKWSEDDPIYIRTPNDDYLGFPGGQSTVKYYNLRTSGRLFRFKYHAQTDQTIFYSASKHSIYFDGTTFKSSAYETENPIYIFKYVN